MFHSNGHVPIQVHVLKDGNEAKYNVSPIEQSYNHGFKKHDIALIESIIFENEEIIVEKSIQYGSSLGSPLHIHKIACKQYRAVSFPIYRSKYFAVNALHSVSKFYKVRFTR